MNKALHSKTPYALHWFRSDLRCVGRSLFENLAQKFEGRVLGVFCFDSRQLQNQYFPINRFRFQLETLKALHHEIRSLGGDLIFMEGPPEEAFKNLFRQLSAKSIKLPTCVSLARPYGPTEIALIDRMSKVFRAHAIATETEEASLLISPEQLTKPGSSEGYRLFTPFAKTWKQLLKTTDLAPFYDSLKALAHFKRQQHEPIFDTKNLGWTKDFDGLKQLHDWQSHLPTKAIVELPQAGVKSLLSAIEAFQKKIDRYHEDRDFPATEGTSRFSTYFANGSLHPGQVLAAFGLDQLGPASKERNGKEKFLDELIWREFYYHILFRYPHVVGEAFNNKYRELDWPNNPEWFERWKNGTTGFPIVDAAMRQLLETGWMHNRCRMIVASFLTKDLLIDWRWGEAYFMSMLIDGDLACNNGGWQWSASTGVDPQPYFRIFNPELQSKRFDPEGHYIRTYIPELRHIKTGEIHAPKNRGDYPAPIVQHFVQKQLATRLFQDVSL
jgi:deoxyribodipyrimidine photo-lyase